MPAHLSNDALDAKITAVAEAARLAGEETTDELDALFAERSRRIAAALEALEAGPKERSYSAYPSQNREIKALKTVEECTAAIERALASAKRAPSRAQTWRAFAAGCRARRSELAGE